MSAFSKPRRGRRPSSTDWLQILDVDGPFLAAPVITDTWPDGLPALAQPQLDALRTASTLYDANPGTRDAFIAHVLTGLLDWRTNLVTGPDAAAYNVQVPEHRQTVDIHFALRGQDTDGSLTNRPLLLGMILPPKTPTTGRAAAGSGTWTAGPADRLAHALRARKVSLGLVTNGDTWTLVTLSKKDGKDETSTLSTADWTRHGWLEEHQTLRAFVALLTRTRFYGVPDAETLPGLLSQSLNRQEEVTERLAEQSQAVVEMLVASIGRLDAHHQAEHGTRLLPAGVGPAEVYQAAVTVLMRLVFLLYAEERGLLPLDDDTYASAYAVNTLADSLRDRATDHGEDALERTATGWYRLLSLFRGVHRGARHEQLILPAYGGSLFDPDRFPWLEGRPDADAPLGSGTVPAVDDRTLLKALDSLQTLQFAKERRQVSYRSLDVEQIGYVYEGLLDQDALTATDWVLSIAVSDKDPRKNGPELLLADLEAKRAISDDAFATWLVEQIKTTKANRSKASILKALTPLQGGDKPRYERLVREACVNDDEITARVLPFAKLLRLDPRDLPVVYPPGSLYLTDSAARANTGAVYTPRFLAEQVVETTLEAIVYSPGPLDTEDKSAWVLKTPEQILGLKICDIAAGSGAFLVAATRYLADRLLESHRYHAAAATTSAVDPETPAPAGGETSAVLGLRELAQAEQDELNARRNVIAHCIYGVDINPMAIEMAKLSLWLTSLDRNRPFSFLDDHLVVGDSLLGITSAQQLIDLHFDPKQGRKLHKDTLDLFTSGVERDLKVAAELRAQITQTGDRDSRDAETKQRLLRRAREVTARLALVADGLTAASLAGGKDSDYLTLASLVSAVSTGDDPDDEALRARTTARLQREVGDGQHRPAHFPLAFPEVFSEGRTGFDAVVGNPPFLGGQKLTGALGVPYREHLLRALGHGVRGSADLIAYMLLRAVSVLNPDHGQCGLIGTNTLAQGDTRQVGLDQVVASGLDIRAAIKSEKWPTDGANLEFCVVWGSNQPRCDGVRAFVDGTPVASITPGLDPAGRVTGNPYRLVANQGIAFQGSNVLGMGFTLTEQRAREMIAADPRNAEVLFPYVNGEDLSNRPDSSGSRWIINFQDWMLERAQTYLEPMAQVLALVKPERDFNRDRSRREIWWRFTRPALELYSKIEQSDRIIAIPQTSKATLPVLVPSNQVFSHSTIVFASSSLAHFSLISSAPHYWWVVTRGVGLKNDPRYTPSDVFQTFPQPLPTAGMCAAGESLHNDRLSFMLGRQLGVTKTYNLVHDPAVKDSAVAHLRDLHVEIDEAVCEAYGWSDLDLRHAHYETRQGVRWTVHPEVQAELLDRLLELNHERYAAEVAAGLHDKKGGKKPMKTSQSKGAEPTLFGDDA
ncbi:MAG TPA: type IIL restriction-modification enzyme MmeI [Jatrophihabitans sp.]|jgi:hypothetical protein|uniref:Eco57I restriction-modification methylase domain-containing protein n=1 Tax=Jatrophihabitans sp. TaxID=1932789 RepID=UPI002F116A99